MVSSCVTLGLSCPLEFESRRRRLSEVPADWNFVLIALKGFFPSLLDGRATGGGLVSARGPSLPFEERGLGTREKSRLRDVDEDEEVGVVESEEMERSIAMFR